MHIGLIGGIGPSATAAFYLRLVERFKTSATKLNVTISHADISLLSANAAKDLRREQALIFAEHINQLKGAGCEVVMITALAGHFCFEETHALSQLPLVNGLKVIDQYCKRHGVSTLGLLGSTTVIETRLFGALRSCDLVIPDNAVQIGKSYLEMATSGACTDEQRNTFFEAGVAMIRTQRAEKILLAGTDLCLAFEGHDPGFPVIDALELHVDALVALSSRPKGR